MSRKIRITYAGVTKELEGNGPFTVGRALDVDFVVAHESVSRRHAEIRWDGDSLWLKDLKSANGVFVNGTEISRGKERKLQPEEKVCLGLPEVSLKIEQLSAGEPVVEAELEPVSLSVGTEFKAPELSKCGTSVEAPTQQQELNSVSIESYRLPSQSESPLAGGKGAAGGPPPAGQVREINAMRRTKEELLAEIGGLYTAKSDLRVEIGQLERSKDQLGAEVQHFKTLAEEAQNGAEVAREEAEQSRRRLDQAVAEERQLESKLKELRQQETSLTEAAQLAVQVAQAAEQRRVAAEERKEALESESALIQAEIEALGARKEEVASERDRVLGEREQVKVHLNHLQSELRALRNEQELLISESKLNRSRIEVEVQDAIAKKAVVETELTVLKMEAERQKKISDATQKQIEESNAKITELKARSEELQAEVTRTEASLVELQSRVSEAEKVLQAERAEVTVLEARYKELSGEIEAQWAKVRAEIQEERAQAQTNLLTAKKQAEVEMEARRNKLDAELSERQARVDAELSERQQMVDSALADQRRRVESELEELRKQAEAVGIERQTRANAELEARKKSFDSEIAERKKAFDLELAELRVREQADAEDRRRQQELQFQARRKNEVAALSGRIEQLLFAKVSAYVPADGKTEFDSTVSLFREAIEDVLLPHTKEKPVPEGLTNLLTVDPDSRQRVKRYWITRGVAAAVVIASVGSWVFFPQFYSAIGNKARAWVGKESASDHFARRIQSEWASRPKYDPEKTTQYKSTYTDNVLRSLDYLRMKEDTTIHKKWILELNRFFLNELGLHENAIVRFASSEIALVRELSSLAMGINPKFEEQGLARMAEAEERGVKELKAIVGAGNYNRFRRFEKKFYETFLSEP